jgi:hypothetical protein
MPSEMVTNWCLMMQDSPDYLTIDSIIPGMAYALWARNAYVGIWVSDKQGFLISRYKMRPNPFLFVEYHWDIGEPFGTAKPLRPLEKCPLPSWSDYPKDEINAELCDWLDELEKQNPPLPGWDSVGERRQSTAQFPKQLARPLEDKSVPPIWRTKLGHRSSD